MTNEVCPKCKWGLINYRQKNPVINEKYVERCFKCPKCNRRYIAVYERVFIQNSNLFATLEVLDGKTNSKPNSIA